MTFLTRSEVVAQKERENKEREDKVSVKLGPKPIIALGLSSMRSGLSLPQTVLMWVPFLSNIYFKCWPEKSLFRFKICQNPPLLLRISVKTVSSLFLETTPRQVVSTYREEKSPKWRSIQNTKKEDLVSTLPSWKLTDLSSCLLTRSCLLPYHAKVRRCKYFFWYMAI